MTWDACACATRSLAFVAAWRGAQTAGHDGLQTTMDSPLVAVGEGGRRSSSTSTQPSLWPRHNQYCDSNAFFLTMNVECGRLGLLPAIVMVIVARVTAYYLGVFLSEPNLRSTLVVRRHFLRRVCLGNFSEILSWSTLVVRVGLSTLCLGAKPTRIFSRA